MSQAAITSLEAAIAEHNRLMDLCGKPDGRMQIAQGGRDATETAWLRETGQWGGLLIHRKREFEVYSTKAPYEDLSDHLLIVSLLRNVVPMPLHAPDAYNVLSALKPAVNLLFSAEPDQDPPAIGILGVGVTVFADQLGARALLAALSMLFVSRVALHDTLRGNGEDHWGEDISERGGSL